MVDSTDEESVRRETVIDEAALAQCRVLARRHLFAYLTTRGPHLRGFTLVQIRTSAPFPAGPLFMMPSYLGLEEACAWKARVLEEVNADAYVGDGQEDREAARLARVMHFDATEFREHGIIKPQSFVTPPALALAKVSSLPRVARKKGERGAGFEVIDATTAAPRAPMEESYGRTA